MSLENYLVKSNVSAVEIRSDFRSEQVEQLYNLVKEIGREKYFYFFRDNLEDILKYISLSPSQRRQKKWVNHPDNLLIRLASLQISDVTSDFLHNIADISFVVDSGSYRDFHTIVARQMAPLMMNRSIFHFPFDGFDNPFFEDKK